MAGSHHSRLERLRRLAEVRERAEAERLRAAHAAENAAARHALGAERAVAERLVCLRGERTVEGVRLPDYSLDRGALLVERGAARTGEARLHAARQGVDAAQRAYLEAHGATSALRRLGERWERARREAMALRAQGLLDELGALRAARLVGDGGGRNR